MSCEVKHYRQDHHAQLGFGLREFWVDCACGQIVWSEEDYIDFVTPEEAFAAHLLREASDDNF